MTQQPSLAQLFSIRNVIAIIAVVVAMIAVPNCVEWLDAKHVMVIQYPWGAMEVFSDPGPKPQWFGTYTKYQRRAQFEFDNSQTICPAGYSNKGSPPMPVRFAEGGNAHICGELSFEMPVTRERMIEIQKDFGSQEAVAQALVKTALTNAIYLSGQTMTSTESSAERRSELLHFIEDQMKEGVYKTQTTQVRETDALTKQERTITKVEIVRDPKTGLASRNNLSAIKQYGIQLVQTSISEIKYEKSVEDQIQAQQKEKASVQVAISKAIRAEQDTRTTIELGRQTAAKAEWEQKTIAARETAKADQEKAVAVTHAMKEKEVAQLEKEAAEFTKQKEILLGQGESERRRLVMSADGALTQKLDAWVKVNSFYATAIQEYKGDWVSRVNMGGAPGSASGVHSAAALIELVTVKTAKELALEVKPAKP